MCVFTGCISNRVQKRRVEYSRTAQLTVTPLEQLIKERYHYDKDGNNELKLQ